MPPETEEKDPETEMIPDAGEQLTPEQFKAQLADAHKRIKELNKESAERRKKLEAFEKLETDKRNADLSDAEKLKEELAKVTPELELLRKEKQELLLQSKFDKASRELKLEYANEKAQEDAYRLMDADTVGEDGSGMKDALTALQKERPYLFTKLAFPETDARNKGRANGDTISADVMAQKRAGYGTL